MFSTVWNYFLPLFLCDCSIIHCWFPNRGVRTLQGSSLKVQAVKFRRCTHVGAKYNCGFISEWPENKDLCSKNEPLLYVHRGRLSVGSLPPHYTTHTPGSIPSFKGVSCKRHVREPTAGPTALRKHVTAPEGTLSSSVGHQNGDKMPLKSTFSTFKCLKISNRPL